MSQTEDIPYSVSEFATPDDEKTPDEDQPNKSVLLEVMEELQKDIAIHNTFDVISLPANATNAEKIAAFDEMAIHKGLALHLNKYRQMIDNKIKELV